MSGEPGRWVVEKQIVAADYPLVIASETVEIERQVEV